MDLSDVAEEESVTNDAPFIGSDELEEADNKYAQDTKEMNMDLDHVLGLTMDLQIAYTDSITTKYGQDADFVKQQLGMTQELKSAAILTGSNARAIGNIAYLARYGPEEYKDAWVAEWFRVTNILKTRPRPTRCVIL